MTTQRCNMRYGYIKDDTAHYLFTVKDGKWAGGNRQCLFINGKDDKLKTASEVIAKKGLKEIAVPENFTGNYADYNYTETEKKITLTTLTDEAQAKYAEQELNALRARRQRECFTITDRGQFWYNSLTETQKTELQIWYQAWLDVTDTKIVPEKPEWL